ncbi:MAG TPA: hypothetical protein VN578_25405 [Candidatus Binatia bacterium]|jgi:hypothetical protein|nr:hypothetical protein [Candidatus Binatia bacterium]
MRIPIHTPRPLDGRRDERGMAVIVVLALLAIIFIYIAANIRTLNYLEKDVKLLELKQTRRLAVSSTTNRHSAAKPQPKS